MAEEKISLPAYRPPSGAWRTTLNHNKEVKEALRTFFMTDGKRMVKALRSLSKFYHSLEKQDRPTGEKGFFLALCQPAFHAYDDLIETFQRDSYPTIDQYLYVYGLLTGAEREIAVWMQVKSIFAESRGLTDASFVEVISKARKDLEAMNAGRKSPKRKGALRQEIQNMIDENHIKTGFLLTPQSILNMLQYRAGSEGSCIRCADDFDLECEVIYWINHNGKEHKTSFPRIRNIVSAIRKGYPKTSLDG